MNRLLYISLLSLLLFSCKSKHATVSGNKTPASEKKESREFENNFYNGCREKLLNNHEAAAGYFAKCITLSDNNPAPKYELANIYFIQNRLPEAILFAKAAVELDKNNVWYTLLYARCLQRKEQYNESAKVLERICKIYPDRTDLHFEWATSLLMSNKYNDAIKVYEEIEKRNGISEDVCLQKERIFLKLGNVDKAAGEIQKLIKLNPREPKYYGILAELYSINGQNQKALETFNKILEVDPENGYVHLSLADYYRGIGDKTKSYEELKTAFKNPQVDIDTKVRILLSYYTVTETDASLKGQAFELLDLLTYVHDNEAKSFSLLGDFLYRDKKTKEARDAYKKAVELDKEKFVIWNQLLLLDSELNDYDDLYTSSKESIELFPTQAIVYLLNGLACIQKKNYTEAITVLKTGVDLVADNDKLKSQFYSYLGDCYNSLKDYKNSDDNYEKALKADENNIYVLNNYGYYLSVRGEKLERAEEVSRKSLSLEPNVPNYEDTYAWILYKQGKFEDAKYWLERAINNGGGGNSTILEHLGDVYFKLNQSEKALEYWNKAKEKGADTNIDKKIKDKKLYE